MIKDFISNFSLSISGIFGLIFGIFFIFLAFKDANLSYYLSGFIILILGAGSIAYIFSKK